jgi:hypothetical protein
MYAKVLREHLEKCYLLLSGLFVHCVIFIFSSYLITISRKTLVFISKFFWYLSA